MKSIQHVFILLFISIILAACGGGGGGGETPTPTPTPTPLGQATATAENSDDLAIAAQEGSKQAVASSGNPFGSLVSADYLKNSVATLTHRLILQKSNSPISAIFFQENGDCGGSATYESDTNNTLYTITFINYCDTADNITVDGVITYTFNSNNSTYTYTYNNVTVTYLGQTHTLNMTATCGSNGCTYSSNYTGSNNVTYTSSNVSVSGNNSSGYNISATITDPTYGSITIVASNITICGNGNIGTGTIIITDSTGSEVISATFPDCSTMIYTYNGVTTTVTQ